MDAQNNNNFNRNNNYNDHSSPDSNKKRRKRVSLTCTSCKKRKVKCDQGKPCSSCVKKRIPPHLCIYEDSPFIPNTEQSTTPTETIILLKDENVKLKAELEELKKWKEIVSGDPMPTPLGGKVQLFENISMKANKVMYFGPTSWRTLLDKEGTYTELVKSAKNYVSSVKREWKNEKNLNDIPYEEYNEINVGVPKTLLDNLANFLPKYDVLKNYMLKYLDGYWNQRLPIIEPEQLMKDFHQIVIPNGDANDGTFTFKILNKSIDYAKIALMVIVLKYMTATNNSHQQDSDYDSRDHLLRYADKLLEFSKFNSKSTIPALQALILIRQFRMINPIDGDGGDSSGGALTFKFAINMAILMGFNKDIDTLYAKSPPYTRQIFKNIWSHLMYQDAVLSFHLGIPLTLEDQYIDRHYFENNDLLSTITMFLREIVRVLTRSDHCSQHEIVSIIEKMENYNNGEFQKLSSSVKELSSADVVLNDFQKLISIELKLFAIYTLHVLYDVLYHGVEDYDPNKAVYYNGTMKYGTLSATHFIEILLRFNKFCVDNKDNEDKLFKIVEMSQSMVGVSKIIFIKIFCAICTFEVIRLFEDDLRSTHPKTLYFSMDITDFEKLNPHDRSHTLNQSYRSPAFLHGLMTLACKYMLKMKNESFQSVFNLNFCLFVVLALFKYFERFIDRKLSKEKETSSLDKIRATVKYEDCEDADLPHDDTSIPSPPAHTTNIPRPVNAPSAYTPTSVTGSISSSIGETRTPTETGLPTQSYMTGEFVTSLTDPIDEMFKDVFRDDNLFTSQMDSNFNWDLNDFLSGTGMFYEDKHTGNNNNAQ